MIILGFLYLCEILNYIQIKCPILKMVLKDFMQSLKIVFVHPYLVHLHSDKLKFEKDTTRIKLIRLENVKQCKEK